MFLLKLFFEKSDERLNHERIDKVRIQIFKDRYLKGQAVISSSILKAIANGEQENFVIKIYSGSGD